MGRIKTKLVKRITRELISKHGDRLKDNFAENKKIVPELIVTRSKKIENMIAGYITKTIKAQKQE